MYQTRLADATITIEDTALCNRRGAPVYRWTLTLDDGRSWSAEDLCGPASGPEPSEEEMARSLFCFLDAALESRAYRERTAVGTENEDLFPAALLDWAEEYVDEIGWRSLEQEDE